ncbi:MAG: hypothetical protein KBH73_10250 [Syntrophobacterales bacterium]|nr:hypothetical protein [Syntrophobacterales bacterium]
MKARAMRKPNFRPEGGGAEQVSVNKRDIAKLLAKEEEVRRHLEDIKTATAALERILATEKGKSTYEIRYVADIDDYTM